MSNPFDLLSMFTATLGRLFGRSAVVIIVLPMSAALGGLIHYAMDGRPHDAAGIPSFYILLVLAGIVQLWGILPYMIISVMSGLYIFRDVTHRALWILAGVQAVEAWRCVRTFDKP